MLHVQMTGRDPEEVHRSATPLELFFDLTFVVAIAQAASALHHGLVDGDGRDAVITFPLVFFAIWWAWVNFTWFASAYDIDDALYRLTVFVQMTGVLILAAGIPRVHRPGLRNPRERLRGDAVRHGGAVAARRVRRSGVRTPALRFAIGLTVIQGAWLTWLAAPDALFLPGFVVLAASEIALPVWAESAAPTSWHPGHIAERYGLFTIIVLGESVLAATVGVQEALDGDSSLGDLPSVVVGGLLIVFAMWWVYFDLPAETVLGRAREMFTDHVGGAFVWSYVHYFVFAGAAATGAGLAVAVDQATGHSQLTDMQAGLAITVPVSAYLLAVWVLYFRDTRPCVLRNYGTPVATVLILASSATPEPVLATGVILAVLVAVNVVARVRSPGTLKTRHVPELHGPVQLRLGHSNRSCVLDRCHSPWFVTAWIPERLAGEHDEGLVVVAEVAVPATGTVERVFERVCEALCIVVGNLEVKEGPSTGLPGYHVPNVGARDLGDGQRDSIHDRSDAQALDDERTDDGHAGSSGHAVNAFRLYDGKSTTHAADRYHHGPGSVWRSPRLMNSRWFTLQASKQICATSVEARARSNGHPSN